LPTAAPFLSPRRRSRPRVRLRNRLYGIVRGTILLLMVDLRAVLSPFAGEEVGGWVQAKFLDIVYGLYSCMMRASVMP
jgi:hypothetical protein